MVGKYEPSLSSDFDYSRADAGLRPIVNFLFGFRGNWLVVFRYVLDCDGTLQAPFGILALVN